MCDQKKGKEVATPEQAVYCASDHCAKREPRPAETVSENGSTIKKSQRNQASDIDASKKHNKQGILKKLSSGDQTGNFSLVKIQIETCPQSTESKTSRSSNTVVGETDAKSSRVKQNSTQSQTQTQSYNSVEPETETESLRNSNSRSRVKKSATSEGSKSTKTNPECSKEKRSSLGNKAVKSCSKVSDKRDVKKQKPSCSPFKKLSRSSLTIEPDKITVNLSKYSPCASRLAASSKILSSNSPTSPESPLRAVRSRSPSNYGNCSSTSSLSASARSREVGTGMEKVTIQASLSLNIRQFQKSGNSTPRSKSVGDSCVTSPTSEGTTTSCSPTGTEILSLDEVGSNAVVNNDADNTASKQTLVSEIQGNCVTRGSQKMKKTTLETKC